MSIDCTARMEFIAALRRLAEFLAANPKVPIPACGSEITVHADGSDTEQRAVVDRIAVLIGAPASEGVHYETVRDFGPISYRAVAVWEQTMTDGRALMSYDNAVSG